jgi:hypothetical protein
MGKRQIETPNTQLGHQSEAPEWGGGGGGGGQFRHFSNNSTRKQYFKMLVIFPAEFTAAQSLHFQVKSSQVKSSQEQTVGEMQIRFGFRTPAVQWGSVPRKLLFELHSRK